MFGHDNDFGIKQTNLQLTLVTRERVKRPPWGRPVVQVQHLLQQAPHRDHYPAGRGGEPGGAPTGAGPLLTPKRAFAFHPSALEGLLSPGHREWLGEPVPNPPPFCEECCCLFSDFKWEQRSSPKAQNWHPICIFGQRPTLQAGARRGHAVVINRMEDGCYVAQAQGSPQVLRPSMRLMHWHCFSDSTIGTLER